MGFAERIISEASQRLELPVDVVAGIPKVELIGRNEFSMEPHDGLLAYSPDQILVKSKLGPVEVVGTDMIVKLMNQERIVIAGKLHGINLPESAP